MSIPVSIDPLGTLGAEPPIADSLIKPEGAFLRLDNDIPSSFKLEADIGAAGNIVPYGGYVAQAGINRNRLASHPDSHMTRLGRGSYWGLYYNATNDSELATADNSHGLFVLEASGNVAKATLPNGRVLQVSGEIHGAPFYLFGYVSEFDDGHTEVSAASVLVKSAKVTNGGIVIYDLKPLADGSGMYCLQHKKKYTWEFARQ